MQIKNFEKAAKRIKKGIKNKENIILFGDADLDGVSSTVILKETLEKLGAQNIQVYFVDREKEGYGPNPKALSYLKKFSPALLITLDCGVSSYDGLKLARSLGFETIIIDHHELLKKIPPAFVIIDPKQKGDKYPFKGLATAGIIFKFCKFILGKKLIMLLENNFLEMAALATIADMMPEIEDNKIFIKKGLDSLRNTRRLGLKAFWQTKFAKNCDSLREFGQRIISALNAMEMKNHLNETYLLFISDSLKKARAIALDLIKKREQKKAILVKIAGSIRNKVLKASHLGAKEVILEGSASLPFALTGPVATSICNYFQKPTFIFKKGKDSVRGSVRMPKGLNAVKAMESCSSLLDNFGGHPLAAGFSAKNKNLVKFRECLTNYFNKHEPR